jgi:hypothetical protein
LVNSVTDVAIRDTQCGFKAFRTPIAQMLFHFMNTNGFAFDVELLYLARRLGMDIAEVPVVWRDTGGSTVKLSDPATMLLEVLRMRVAPKWPQIPALVVASIPGKCEPSIHGTPAFVLNAVMPNLPILPSAPDRTLILFPLREAQVRRDAAVRLRSLFPNVSVAEQSVVFADLVRLAPFTLLKGMDDETPRVVAPKSALEREPEVVPVEGPPLNPHGQQVTTRSAWT